MIDSNALADILLPGPVEPGQSWRWATVTQVSPLRVRLDGDTTALDLTPDSLLVLPPVVGQRVHVHMVDRSLVVVGAPASSTGAWATYTPTITGLTLGNGTVDAQYAQIGRTVHVGVTITLGSASTMGSLAVSLPVSSAAQAVAPANLYRNGFGLYAGIIRITSLMSVFFINPSTGVQQALSPTVPWTWGAGDYVVLSATYQSAT